MKKTFNTNVRFDLLSQDLMLRARREVTNPCTILSNIGGLSSTQPINKVIVEGNWVFNFSVSILCNTSLTSGWMSRSLWVQVFNRYSEQVFGGQTPTFFNWFWNSKKKLDWFLSFRYSSISWVPRMLKVIWCRIMVTVIPPSLPLKPCLELWLRQIPPWQVLLPR